jgi:CHASE3 domain sensor protein
MGQEVLCPYCGAQFVMRYKATREFKDERQRKEDAQQQKLGENWLMWAVIVGVGVLVMLVGMMILSSR